MTLSPLRGVALAIAVTTAASGCSGDTDDPANAATAARSTSAAGRGAGTLFVVRLPVGGDVPLHQPHEQLALLDGVVEGVVGMA